MKVTRRHPVGGDAPDALACRPHGHPPPARPLRPARRIAARGRRDGLGRGRALPPHVHDAAALLGRDAPAGARALARGDELQPAPAGQHERAGPRRVHVRGAAPAGRHLQGEPDRDGPGGGRVPPPRDRRPRDLGGARGARPPPLVVRQRHGHAGRAARLDLGPRRPDPDARRLPDRVEQAARAGARDRAPAPAPSPTPRTAPRASAAPWTTGCACATRGTARSATSSTRSPRAGWTCASACSAAARSATRA